MIRWKYAIPRLVLVALIAATLTWGLGPLLKWTLVGIGQSATGARVTIGHARTSWSGAKMQLAHLEVADPKSPNKNLFQADRISLDLDARSLLRRKFIADRGEVRGLRLATDRELSGALTPAEGKDSSAGWGEEMAEWGEKWFDNAADLLKHDVQEELESVRLTQELMQRWPPEYDRLEERAQRLRRRIDRLRQVTETTKDPLGAVQAYPQVAADVQQLRRELVELRAEADRLQQQARADKGAIAQAKKRDIETIRNKLRLENLNSENLSRYLLGPDLGPKVTSLLDWIRWGRRCVPSKSDRLTAKRGRGVDIVFPGREVLPDFLIRTLAVQGQADVGRDGIKFEGSATGLSSQPQWYDHPVELQLTTRGAAAMVVQAVLDRRHQTPRDRFLIDCPGLAQGERVLGDPNRLAVTVSPGRTHAWTLLNLDDEALAGEIVLKQQPVDLVPRLAPGLGADSLTPVLQQALAQVKSLDVAIALSGSLDKPRCELRSNVGTQLADGINRAVHDQLTARRQELVTAAEEQIAHQMQSFERTVVAKRDAVLEKVQLGDAEIQRILGAATGSRGLPGKLLGRDSPLRAILSR